MMQLLRVVPAGITHPFGDHRAVTQAFPAAIPSEQSDPFLMCDSYASESKGVQNDPDSFDVAWHPHRGMDILSYLKTGVGRHGDSMGNRETFATPGMQWISCGSGIEHAEGGGTPKGELISGFQIWINVPSEQKMADPRYGTEPPDAIPQVELSPGVHARLLAGNLGGSSGPFQTVQPVQMIDFELASGASLLHEIPAGMDTCMVYVYEGEGNIAGKPIGPKSIALFNASSDATRMFELTANGATSDSVSGAGGKLCAMIFAGNKLKEPIAWHGPIVMNTQKEIQQALHELRSGTFPPKRVEWDYRRLATRTEAEL
ncbi:hypothetical protein CYMTET_14789 [Cymbomonas tetramitiformis]|uniref:Pirin n=1 Tax=Cymbomonas tetramitiformis TaxID=36881 RepID=A0AAE0LA11_9CHLO|nr:hypothetical protein CYMTET_14789 [Cymbomonas tetramitiformis]|eukprot:gene5433-6588_t